MFILMFISVKTRRMQIRRVVVWMSGSVRLCSRVEDSGRGSDGFRLRGLRRPERAPPVLP
jgi:hypothetical protein